MLSTLWGLELRHPWVISSTVPARRKSQHRVPDESCSPVALSATTLFGFDCAPWDGEMHFRGHPQEDDRVKGVFCANASKRPLRGSEGVEGLAGDLLFQ
jgi:hypothetical protein